MNKSKTNKGITLVALVITIIVLIILAGVSINAVLNGGIITNAKDAKNQYNEGKVKEETALIDLEVQSDIEKAAANGEKIYKFQNTYLTGLEYDSNIGGYTLTRKLPEGYSIWDISGKNEIEEYTNTSLTTGMIIKKNGKQVGRIVIYGDVDCNGGVNTMDLSEISKITGNMGELADYQMVASDVNHDGIINYIDIGLIGQQNSLMYTIDQDAYGTLPKVQTDSEIIEAYLQTVSSDIRSRFVLYEGEYDFEGVTSGTTVGELLAILPENTTIGNYSDDRVIKNGFPINIIDKESGATLKIANIVI